VVLVVVALAHPLLVALEIHLQQVHLRVIMVELLALTEAVLVVAQGLLVVLVAEQPPEMVALALHPQYLAHLSPTLVAVVAVEVNLLALAALQQVAAVQAVLTLITMVQMQLLI
jgi:hypothetical protein